MTNRTQKFSVHRYLALKHGLGERGYWSEIDWAEAVGPPKGATAFWYEYAFVVINSGMKAEVARGIYEKVIRAVIEEGRDARSAFGHPGKSAAIMSRCTTTGSTGTDATMQP